MESEIDILRREVQDLKAEILSLKQKQHSSEQSGRPHIACEQAALDLQKESQRLMDYIIRHDPNAIAVFDDNLRYIFVSERYLDDYKVKDRNIIGKHHYEVFPEMPERWKRVHQRVLAGAVERAEEDRFERLDGFVDYNRWECRPWYRLDGSIGGMITYTEVITERKLAEEALRESNQIIEGILNAIPVRVFWKDRDLIYLGCNAVFAHDAGFTDPKDIIGKDDYQMGWHDQAEIYRGDDRQVIESGCAKLLIEEPQTTPEGNTITLLTSKIPLRNFKGEVNGVLGTYMDITERKRIEDALRVSEEIFNSFMEHCPVYVFFKDETTRPIRLSRNYEQLLGRPIEYLLGKTMDQLFPSELSKKMVEDDLSVIINGKQIEVVEELNGRIFETTKFPIIQPGKSTLLAGFTVDITDRRRTEEALLQSEELYRGIFENASIGITRVSLDGIYREVNPAMTRILGYSPAELTGRPVADFTYPDDQWRRAHFLSDLIEGKIVSGEQERRFVHKNGSVVWTLITASVQRNQSGKPLCFISLVQDITDRKLAEEALRKSQDRYRTLVESAPIGIFTTSSSGQPLAINLAMARILGCISEEEALERYADLANSLYVQPERRNEFIRQLRESDRVENFEYEARAAAGRNIWLNMSARIANRTEDGSFTIEGFATDITERKLADEALRDSEERHRKIIEASSDAIILRSSGGIVIYANPAALKLFRANNPTDLIGKRYLDLVHPDDRAISAGRVKKSMDENWIAPLREHRLLALDGQVVHVESTGMPFKYRGDTQHFGAFRDITERKLAEQEKQKTETQLRQAQKMEAIGSLAGGIAHDFNNILSVIIGNTELLEMSDVSSNVKDGLHQVFAASQRAKQLVRQILSFSRQGEQQKLLMSLKPIVKETIDFLRASIPSTIKLQHYIKPDAGAVVADSTQMQQVLMNLCTNAAHAMENEGGVLKIVLDTKTIAEEDVRLDPGVERGEYVRLSVSDTGHGIESALLHRIFDPYFTTKGPDKGTGLGLAVVHGIVKSHGGIIRVYSEVGKGTVFHVLLPRADEAPKKEEKAVRLLPSGTERILVVDDEKPLADIYEKMLGMLGYQVEIRTSPVEAFEAVRMNPEKYDLVITDMTMPQMTGYSLSKKLMEIRPGLPVILCTGFSDLVNEEKARSVGILAFLLKPVPLHDLANTMRKVLDETHREKHS